MDYYKLHWKKCWILTTLGVIVSFILVSLCGCKKEKYREAIVIRCKIKDCGFTLGYHIFVCEDADEALLSHEYGHTLQNILYGNKMIIKVTIPSTVRFWRRRFDEEYRSKEPYDAAWFEAEATMFGKNIKEFNTTEQLK